MKKIIVCTSFNSQFSKDLMKRYNRRYILFFLTSVKKKISKNVIHYSNIKDLNKIITRINPDIIWHNSAISQQKKSFLYPNETFNVNLNSTVQIIEAIKNIKKNVTLIFFSTSAVYSQSIRAKISENDKLEPSSPYSFSKIYSEQYIKYFSKIYKFNFLIFRPFLIVSNYKKNGLIWDFKNKIKNYIRFNKKIFLGDIDKIRRDFLHVTVANDMIINLLENKNYNQVFNLCSSKSVKLSKIFSYLSSKYKINIPYEIDKNINNKFENNIRIGNNAKIFSFLKDCKKTELDIFRYI